jgi:serpin B
MRPKHGTRWMGVWLIFGMLWLSAMPAYAAVQKDMQSVTEGNTAFALDLYIKLGSQEEGNFFFSPYSISTALAMIYAGARSNTAEDMAKVLHFGLEQERLHAAFSELADHFAFIEDQGYVKLSVANALWIQRRFELLQAFLTLTQKYYGAAVFQLDFVTETEASRQQINRWVAEKTYEKIDELLKAGDVTPETVFVLTNAIYFKGDWLSPFKEEQTQDATFRVSSEKQVMTPMMTQKGSFEYAQDEQIQILALPYAGEELQMLIFLPKAEDGLPELEKQFDAETFQRWLSLLYEQKVRVSLPKFIMRSRFDDLLSTLGQMGMKNFSDFSGISPAMPQLSKIIHEAFVEVNEQGTEAAAATAVVFGRSLQRYIEFTADHPFIFLIYDASSGSVLFLGRMTDPTAT